jgi:NADH:ubiquinone oxidoreductase subunit B-like Fe-S oxidoreductase
MGKKIGIFEEHSEAADKIQLSVCEERVEWGRKRSIWGMEGGLRNEATKMGPYFQELITSNHGDKLPQI